MKGRKSMLKKFKRTAALLAIVLVATVTSVFASGDVLISCDKPVPRFNASITSLDIHLENTTGEQKYLTVISVTYGTNGLCKKVEIAEALPVAAGDTGNFTIPVRYANVNEVVKLIAAEQYNGMLFPVNSQMLECSKANYMKLVNQ